jgi:hypothetical protein
LNAGKRVAEIKGSTDAQVAVWNQQIADAQLTLEEKAAAAQLRHLEADKDAASLHA